MKKFIYILGIILLNLLMAGLIFKMNHWPGAGVQITLSLVLLVIVFFPLALVNSYRKQAGGKHTALYVISYITILIMLGGALFKVMHWPGAGILLFIGIPLPFVLFFPMYLRFHKKTQKNYDLNFFGVIFFLLFLAVFGALQALQLSKNVVDGFAKITNNTTTLTQNMESRIDNLYQSGLDSLSENTRRKQFQSYHAMGKQLDQTMEAFKKELAITTNEDNKQILAASTNPWQNLHSKESRNANYLMWYDENNQSGQLLKQYHAFVEETKRILAAAPEKNTPPEDWELPMPYSPEMYIRHNSPGTNLIANVTVVSLWQQHIRHCELEALRNMQP